MHWNIHAALHLIVRVYLGLYHGHQHGVTKYNFEVNSCGVARLIDLQSDPNTHTHTYMRTLPVSYTHLTLPTKA